MQDSPSAMSRREWLAGWAVGAAGLCVAPRAAHARSAPIYTGRFSSLGLKGYDPVAYFEGGRPVEGLASHSLSWRGATWRFSTPVNLEAFRADPVRYAPQYGGYCAWATAKGYLAPGDPRFWRIVGGKLYVNYDAGVQRDWERDVPGFVTAADANWPAILDRN